MEIRQLNTNDTKQFCNLILNMYSHLNNLEWFTPMPFDYESVKAIIEKPRLYILGAFENNMLVGVSSLDYKCGKLIGKVDFPKECDTSKLVELGFGIVHTEYRGRRILQTLIEKIFEKIKKDNLSWSFAKIHQDNMASLKSCQNKGFEKFADMRKVVNKQDFKNLADQPFFCQEGKENAKKTLSKFENDEDIIVNYNLLIREM